MTKRSKGEKRDRGDAAERDASGRDGAVVAAASNAPAMGDADAGPTERILDGRPGQEPRSDVAPDPEATSATSATASAPVPAISALPDRSDDPGFDPDLRVAHVLLRTGSPMPARAHLETLAGSDRLDRQGLLDLAESRWRTGDLHGAGEATVAYLEHGGTDALAFLIAAEATAATGRPSEAARFARRALDGLTLPLDAVFAGQPRSPIWPTDPADPGIQAGTLFAEPANDATRGGRIGLTSAPRGAVEASPRRPDPASGRVGVMAEPAFGDLSTGSPEGRPERSLWDEPERARELVAMVPADAQPPGWNVPDAATEPVTDGRDDDASSVPLVDRAGLDPALPDAGTELDGAREALDAGDNRAAAVRLAVVLRLRPALAPAVLEMIGDIAGPDFDLLRGDAFRLVGHEAAAQRAFASAANALPDPSDPRSDE